MRYTLSKRRKKDNIKSALIKKMKNFDKEMKMADSFFSPPPWAQEWVKWAVHWSCKNINPKQASKQNKLRENHEE